MGLRLLARISVKITHISVPTVPLLYPEDFGRDDFFNSITDNISSLFLFKEELRESKRGIGYVPAKTGLG